MHGDGLSSRRFKRGTAPLIDVVESELQDLTPDPEGVVDVNDVSARTVNASREAALPIPLPTEIPPPPRLSSLPPQILHSGTVETLIGQNEDLMARLKVNLRRNALLEQHILELERTLAEARQHNESLQDQVHIVHEKDKMWKEKNARIEGRYEEMQEEIDLLRLKLSELSATSQSKLRVLETYMRRVRRWVRPGMKRAKARFDAERQRTREFLYHVETLRKDLSERDAQVAELSSRLEAMTHHQRERERRFNEDQAQLVDTYETRLKETEEQNEKLTTDVAYFRERAGRLDEMTRKQVETENKAILLGRKNQELERKLNTEVHQFQDQAATYRGEAKSLAVEVEALRAELEKIRERDEKTRAENERLSDQVESLQTLWAENRKNSEQLELRMEALTNINQELSRKLKEQRLEREAAAMELKTANALAAAAAGAATAATKRAQETVTAAKLPTDRLSQIDSVLAGIESGFPAPRSPEAAKVRELEILESIDTGDSERATDAEI